MVKKTVLNTKETPKKNNTTRNILIIIAIIIIFIVASYVSFIIKYKILFDWWKKGGGKSYKNLFNIKTMMAARASNFWYFFFNLGDPPLSKFTTSQYLFIISHLLQYIRYTDPTTGRQQGILTPYSLCKGIILSSEDPSADQRYLDWLTNNPKRGATHIDGTGGIPVKQNSNNALKYIQSKANNCDINNKNVNCHLYKIDPTWDKNDTNPDVRPYPDPNDRESWKGLVLEWLNGFSSWNFKDENIMWIYASDGDEKNIMKLAVFPNLTDKSDTLKNWLKDEFKISDGSYLYHNGAADNFLSRFGIVPDSPLFIFWFNNEYETNGMKVDTSTFDTLLYSNTADAGGWVGFLKNNDSYDTSQYTSLVKSHESWTPPDPPPPCKPQSGWMIFVNTFAVITASLSMLAFTGLTGGAAIGIYAAAAVAGGSSLATSLTKKC
jgi:hypothetical protein